MATILIEKGRDKGRAIALTGQDRFYFGRDSGCHGHFDDAIASRQHFCVERDGDDFFVSDLGSRNGTYLNSEKIKKSRLNFGDHIIAGDTIFSFLTDDEAKERGGLVGQSMSGFQIEERVGRGGSGTVYRATQQSLSRPVALKILSHSLTNDPVFVARFVQEARAAGKLNNPHIVQVFDVGEDKGTYYMSMEYLPGGSMEDLLNHTDRILPIGALTLMRDVARGLQFAEANHIVHRDIKPDNLMLDSEGHVKIGDLGIAINLRADGRKNRSVAGTPHYMAPEQALGNAVDQRADVYSLGCTMYRMLSGQMPFTGATHKEILEKQITYDPPPLHKFVEEVPQHVSDLVARMMAKDPQGRPEDATALLKELDECIERESTGRTPEQTDDESKQVRLQALGWGTTKRRRPPAPAGAGWKGSLRTLGSTAAALIVVVGLVLLGASSPDSSHQATITGTSGQPESSAASKAVPPTKIAEPRSSAPSVAVRTRASRQFREAREFEARYPQQIDQCVEKYKSVYSMFPRLAEGKQARASAVRLARQKKLAEGWERKWEGVVAQAQEHIDLHRFGEALSLFDAFEKANRAAPQVELARNCAQHVRGLAERTFQKRVTTAEGLQRKGDDAAARAIYRKVISTWGLEPFVSQAQAKVVEAKVAQAEQP